MESHEYQERKALKRHLKASLKYWKRTSFQGREAVIEDVIQRELDFLAKRDERINKKKGGLGRV